MESKDGKAISEVMNNLLGSKSRLANQYQLNKLDILWRELMGQWVADHTTKLWLRDKVLTVYMSSATIKEELMMHRDTIIENLNNRMSYRSIEEIQIR